MATSFPLLSSRSFSFQKHTGESVINKQSHLRDKDPSKANAKSWQLSLSYSRTKSTHRGSLTQLQVTIKEAYPNKTTGNAITR